MSSSLSEEGRLVFKKSLGIREANNRNKCSNCYYHPYKKICNKHFIKTENNETCSSYKKDTKFKFTNGGSMSPR